MPWKGNVRELRSAIEQALLLAPGDEIAACRSLRRRTVRAVGHGGPDAARGASADQLPRGEGAASSASFERDFLLDALRRHGGNITKAAEEVGMYRQNFQQKMRELGITPKTRLAP